MSVSRANVVAFIIEPMNIKSALKAKSHELTGPNYPEASPAIMM